MHMETTKENFRHFDEKFPDGRLTAPPTGKIYKLRAMLEKEKLLGRELTDEEIKEFVIN